jgi:hypothetical protein
LVAEKDSDISAFQILDKSNSEKRAKNADKLKGAAKSKQMLLNNNINFQYYAKRNTQKSKNAKPAPPKPEKFYRLQARSRTYPIWKLVGAGRV